MGFGEFFLGIEIFCLATRLIDFKTPVCAFDSYDQASIASIGANDPAQAIKERLMAMPNTMGIEIPEGPIGKAEAEGIMSSATSLMRAHATIGPDAMTEDELEAYMARLTIPEPTTMLTVATNTPTAQSPH